MNRKTLIFLHQPKTGGSTLRELFDRLYPAEQTFVMQDNSLKMIKLSVQRLRAMPEEERRKLRVLAGHMPFGLHRFLPQEVTYVTMLREPVERVVSHIGHIVRMQSVWGKWDDNDPRIWGQKEFLRGGATPEAFIEWMDKYGLNNLQTRALLEPDEGFWDDMDRPLEPLSPEAVEQAKKNLTTRFDIVGTQERYDETLLLMKRHLGWKNAYYTKANVTVGRKSRQEFSPAAIEMIRERNQYDLEVWKFASELLDQSVAKAGASLAAEYESFKKWNPRVSVLRGMVRKAREKVQLRTRIKRMLGAGG